MKDTLKIAYILPSIENKGPNVFTQYLINGIKDNNVDITVFYFRENQNDKLLMGVNCERIDFWKRMDFGKFDIVHTTMARPDIFGMMNVPCEKWVVSMHNYLVEDVFMSHSRLKSTMISFIWRFALNRAKNVIVSSNQMREYYAKLLSESKDYICIPYGINEKEYFEADEVNFFMKFKNEGKKVIGSVGSLIKRKGFAQLIELVKHRSDVILVLIGDGEEKEKLIEMCIDYGVQDRVFFVGFVDNSYNYYQCFDVYMHVSYSEGFGLAMLEAMSKKVPIVCSRLDIYCDYFSDKDVAFFEPGNLRSLEAAYDRICNNIEEYSDAAYKLFLNKFSLKHMAESHYEYYCNVKEKGKSQSHSRVVGE